MPKRATERLLHRYGWCLPLLLLLLSAALQSAAAQQLPLKRTAPAVAPSGGCLAAAPPPAPSQTQRDQAERLASAGTQASILGDNEGARDLLKRALALDPTDAETAYRLARVQEEMGDSVQAVQEYCRYLNIATGATDAAEVRRRVAALAPRASPAVEQAAAQFRAGVAAYDRKQPDEAVRAFSEVIRQRPDEAAARYNRALAYAAANRPIPAAQELEAYLQLAPQAGDRDAVQREIARLRGSTTVVANPSYDVLIGGLLLPGFGQFRTGRPAFGALVVAGAVASAYVGFRPQTENGTCNYPAPFGGTYQAPCEKTTRPNAAAGLGLAAAITAFSAIEAFYHARHPSPGSGPPPAAAEGGRAGLRLSPSIAPSAEGVEIGVRLTRDHL